MAAAFATVAFVAFISMLLIELILQRNMLYLASIGTAGRTTLGSILGSFSRLVKW